MRQRRNYDLEVRRKGVKGHTRGGKEKEKRKKVKKETNENGKGATKRGCAGGKRYNHPHPAEVHIELLLLLRVKEAFCPRRRHIVGPLNYSRCDTTPTFLYYITPFY